MENTRRNFLKKSAMMGIGALMIPELAKAVVNNSVKSNFSPIKLKENTVILFQGDSITDCGRDRTSSQCNTIAQLSNGYVLFTAAHLLAQQPQKQLKIYNKGISGNKVFELRNRWEIDCIAIQPDVLSILIGVNDYWHTLSGGYKGTATTYENDYRALLKTTKEKLPNTQLIICEPFTIEGGSAIKEKDWFPMFDEYRKIARNLATEFNAVFVPYQAAFDEAVKYAPAHYWGADGVHPDLPGRELMASVWLESTGLK